MPSAGSEPPRAPSLFEAALPLLAMLGLLVAGALLTDLGRELLVVVMLAAAAVASWVARRVGKTWDDVQAATGRKLADVLPAILILLAIGMLIASWVWSGTIPMLVHLGLAVVDPRYLVITAFLATALMSLCTGTSWGSAGTLGVALMGMAAALGADLGVVAGAVVSGAYFGDKMSPLSDSTNISAIGAGAELYAHIRHMLYTAVPSLVLCLLVFGFLAPAPAATAGLPAEARRLMSDIEAAFSIGVFSLLPPVVVVAGIVRRVPPVIAMTASSLVALVLGVLWQGFSVIDAVKVPVSGFDAGMLKAAPPLEHGEAFKTLVERGGLDSMVGTLLVILAAFLLAGAMEASGALDLLIRRLLGTVRSVFGLIVATMTAGATTIALTSHGGVTALVVGGLFQGAYSDRGLAPVNLSRSLEDSVTLTEPLMPWTVSAAFMAATLGVATVDYLPWAVFCFGGPLFSLLLAATYRRTGFGVLLADADGTAGR